jgi:hypothetical protein
MSTFRFTVVAVALFALTFVGVSWGNKGFPVMAVGVAPMKPDARIPSFEESVKAGIRKDWENSKTLQSDGDKERDKLRLDLLQAANAYALSPCDDTMKKNLVAALTNYTEAWFAKAHCKPGVDGCSASASDRLDAAAAAFKTAADVNVHRALRKAIDQGGISREDFPSAIRNNVFMWSGMPFGEPRAACIVTRQAQQQR